MPIWSFVYQYAVGGVFFTVLTVLVVRSRAIDLRTPSGRRSLAMLLAGFALYAGGHAFSVFLLPQL